MHFLTQYWNVWNEVEMFEYSRIHFIETKKGLSSEYLSNFTSVAKRTSNPLIRPNSMCFKNRQDVMGKFPIFGPNFANKSHTHKMML
jgi:hypothetical protein